MRKIMMGVLVLVIFCFLNLALAVTGSVAADKSITIRIGSTLVKSHPHSLGAYRLGEIIKQKTNGRIKVQYYPNSQLGTATEQLSGARMGSQEMFFGANGRISRIIKEFNLLSPSFCYASKEEKLAVINSPYFEGLRETLRKKMGLRVLNYDWFRGYRNLLTNKPVMTLEDLQGVKLRVPPSSAKVAVWKGLGASPTPISSKEQFMALKEGIIDGAEHNILSIRGKHLDEVAKNFLYTRHEPIYAGFTVGEKFWSSLSPQDQKIIMDSINECRAWVAEKMENIDMEYEQDMTKEQNVTFRKMNPAEREKWFKKAEKVIDDLENDKKWWPKGTLKKIRAKDPEYYRPM